MSRAYYAGGTPRTNKKSYEEKDWREAAGDALGGLPFLKNSRGEVAFPPRRILDDNHILTYDRNYDSGHSYKGYLINVRDSKGRLIEVRRPGDATKLNKALQKIRKTYAK